MAWPVTFANLGGGGQALSLFDLMFGQVAQMIAIPCSAVGQNSITLTPIGNAPVLPTNYTEFCAFRFKAVQTSTSALTAQFTALANLPVYFADGVTQCAGGATQLGQEYVLVFSQALNGGSGGFFLESAAVAATTAAAGGLASGLSIKNNLGSPNTQLDVSVTELVLNNTTGNALRSLNQAFTINFANVGVVNGLDTGAIASNKFYFIWAISNGSTVGGLASLQSTFAGLVPTLPAGYSFGKLLGAWRTSQSVAQLMGGVQFGTHFQYIQGVAQTTTSSQQAIAGNSGNPNAAASLTSVSLAALVPAIAKSFDFYIQMGPSGGPSSAVCAAPSNSYGAVSATTNPPPISISMGQTGGAGVNSQLAMTARGTFAGPGPVFYANNNGGGLWVDGYDVNL